MPFDLSAVPPLYLILPGLVILGALVRRVPVLGKVVSVVTWIALLGTLIVVVGERQRFDPYLSRIGRALSLDGQQVVGDEVRIRMAPDGHFWARATLGGVERRMLIDSGATVTALSPATAQAAGLDVREPLVPVLLRTANGTIRAQTATVERFALGNIAARNVEVVVSPGLGETDVIGMNLLSRLKSWRVEGRTLILVPHHPQKSTT
ncbi:retropepsin-like aspartic protease family protein [Sphingomonas sp.]|jgi:aspartyl protease family protein|uniref:retropepsin-like aspartic protease family protein n=1 Tax=Sphingomonas sp. TaxID=28214 RepID=UPI002ED91F55